MVDLYHHTTEASARKIMGSRKMIGEPGPAGEEAYFTTEPGKSAQAGGRGEGTVHIRVPEHMARLDDEFPSGERHYAIPVGELRPEHFIGEPEDKERGQ
jgi:hypothetical protein